MAWLVVALVLILASVSAGLGFFLAWLGLSPLLSGVLAGLLFVVLNLLFLMAIAGIQAALRGLRHR